MLWSPLSSMVFMFVLVPRDEMLIPRYLYDADAVSHGTVWFSIFRKWWGLTMCFFFFPSITICRLADFPPIPALMSRPLFDR